MKTIFVLGNKIYLGPLSKKDTLNGYVEWINDQDTTIFMGSGRFPMNTDDLNEYIKSYSLNKDGMLLGIFSKKTSKHIGNISLHMIDWRNRNAEVGVILGDKHARGKGYATEAICLVADHAFNKLNLRKLYAGMTKGNDASKRVFEKAGFKVEGILREHFYLGGRYIDCYRMGLLDYEFKTFACNNNAQ